MTVADLEQVVEEVLAESRRQAGVARMLVELLED